MMSIGNTDTKYIFTPMRPRDREGNASRVQVGPFRNIESVEEALKLSVLRDPQKREPVWPCRGLVGHNLLIAIKRPKRGQSNPEAEADSPNVWIPSREIRNIGPGASRPVRALRRSNLGSSLVLFYRSSTQVCRLSFSLNPSAPILSPALSSSSSSYILSLVMFPCISAL